MSPDAFRNELYQSSSPNEFQFDTVITHRAEINANATKEPDTAGADAALAALQSSMASYEQEKKAKGTTISENVLPEYKNRFEAAKKQKRGGLLGITNSGASSPSLSAVGTPRPGTAVTSAPSDSAIRTQAMRTPIIHLLAMKPTSTEDIISQTHVPKSELESILSKLAQQVDGKWKLLDRAFKELDAWDFGYKTRDDRQSAIDNAIRAYDRQRIGKEEKLWQMLLPKDDRGKGKVLSKLHLGTGQQNKGLTPNWMPSPRPNEDEDERPATSSANTERLGPSGTPKLGAAKTGGTNMQKRLLAKDPKKARAAEEAKEKKKREREAAASDREGAPATKRQRTTAAATAAKTSSKIKSAELVHSSDDDDDGEDGEIKDAPVKAAASAPRVNTTATKAGTKPKPRPATHGTSPDSSDAHVKAPTAASKSSAATKSRTGTPVTKAIASPALKATKAAAAGRSTPLANGTTTQPHSQHKTQLSPNKHNARPHVPSPLGAARPRVASDVSDRSAVGIQRRKNGAETPKGLGITTGTGSGIRKRQDTVTSRESFTSSDGDRKRAVNGTADKARKAASGGNGTPKPAASASNGIIRKPEATGLKRKATDTPSQATAPASKHRKTDSTSSTSQRSHSSSITTNASASTTTGTSPDAVFDSGSSDSSVIMDQHTLPRNGSITYQQGVSMAQRFKEYYPQYGKLYDAIAEKQDRGEVVGKGERERLWEMHEELRKMKELIEVASKRQ